MATATHPWRGHVPPAGARRRWKAHGIPTGHLPFRRTRAGAPDVPARVGVEAGRNAALDGLRFVAVAAVLAWHFDEPGGRAGFLGVDIFLC